MIDLHIHTTYSDGTDPVAEVLAKAEQVPLEVLAITDHNSCQAFFELDQTGLHRKGCAKLLVGCEFTTSFGGRLIEVLGYGFDHRRMQLFLQQHHSAEANRQRLAAQRERLMQAIRARGISLCEEQVRPIAFPGERPERPFYDAICAAGGAELLAQDGCETFGRFYRNGLTNPASRWFLGYDALYPSLDEVIGQIHRLGGLAFLAHPYQYRFAEVPAFLDAIYEASALDGVECFHTTCSRAESELLLAFAARRKLLISGGSDYHGTNKTSHDLGVGCGNLCLDRDLLTDWNVTYYQ